MREWLDSYGKLPSSYSWSRTHAKSRGNVAFERLGDGERPAASVVSQLFGTWKEAREAVAGEAGTSTAAAKFWGMPGIPSGRPDGTLYATAFRAAARPPLRDEIAAYFRSATARCETLDL